MTDATYNTVIYFDPGRMTLTVSSGGTIDVESGATLNVAGTATVTGTLALGSGGTLDLSELPTSDPGVAGEAYSDSGVVTISAGT